MSFSSLRQKRAVPLRPSAGREALLAEVPLLAVLLPRHLRFEPPPSSAAAARGTTPTACFEELAERRRVDLRLLVDDDDDLLPRPGQLATSTRLLSRE